MQNVKRLVVDLSSLCWTALFSGEDKENGYTVEFEGKTVKVASAGFGFEYAVDLLTTTLERFGIVPSDVILVEEGQNSKALRKFILPDYKGHDKRPPESYEEFNMLKARLIDAFCSIGASAVSQDGIEADDVIAYLAKNLQGEVYILSNDKDLAVLVGGNVHQLRQGALDENALGPFPHKYISLYLALVGDSSDKIPGAKGFGPKAFLDLFCVFGADGLDALTDLIRGRRLDELQEDVAELKVLQKIIDSADMVYKSWDCAKLYPEKVNTMRMPLKWRAGMVKPRTKDMDARLAPFAGQVRLVHKGNYAAAVDFLRGHLDSTPYFTLDIETSTPEESDEWLMKAKGKTDEDKDLGVDVFGSKLAGLALTFGANRQYTYYFTVDHVETDDVKNLTSIEVLEVMDMLPSDKPHVIQNVSFELTVLHQEWGKLWDNGDWQGFIPNAYDTKIMASYVDENKPKGLKQRSLEHLGYQQETFQEVTTISGVVGTLPSGGKRISVTDPSEGDSEAAVESRQYKMNELTAAHVLSYGADDTICTSALFTWYRIVMELEKTFEVFEQVEILPAYVTALAYVQGCKVSLERLKELEREDDKAYDEAKLTLDKFLIEQGWEGTICPVYEEITPAAIKEAFMILTGEVLSTQVRTVAKFVPLLEEAGAHLLAKIVKDNDLDGLNKLVASRFKGEPEINFDSPKQMQKFLYHTLGLPVRIVNKLTPKERETNKPLASAVSKFNKIWQGSQSVTMTDEELEIIKAKAATDDTAVEFAMQMDATEEQKVILNAMVTLKTVSTRRKLYYRPYPLLTHWKDGKLHSSMNQSEAATRRYSSGGPNLQQMPKKGEGVKVRSVVVPHTRDGVIISLDYSGQELRLGAEQSQCPNMLACYVGDSLKDLHSLTASGAMRQKWGTEKVMEYYAKYGADLDPTKDDYTLFTRLRKEKETAKIADDLRKIAKVINFGSAYGAQAAKLAQTLVISVEDAQVFLDARAVAFARVNEWNEEMAAFAGRHGYALTMMGARRHLAHSVTSEDKWEAERAARQAPNFAIQGSAAEQTKLGMSRLWKSGLLFSADVRFIAPIHDELVLSAHRDDAVEAIRVLNECMTGPYASMKVPVIASISLGPNFGEQYEAGDDFDASSIANIIDKIFEKDVNMTT